MTVAGFRFAPPDVAMTPALRWVLARAYAAADTAMAETEGGAAVALAQRLGLAARIATPTAAGAAHRRARTRGGGGVEASACPRHRAADAARRGPDRGRRDGSRPAHPLCAAQGPSAGARRLRPGRRPAVVGSRSPDSRSQARRAPGRAPAPGLRRRRRGLRASGSSAAAPGRRHGRAASRSARRPPRAQAFGHLRDARRGRPLPGRRRPRRLRASGRAAICACRGASS